MFPIQIAEALFAELPLEHRGRAKKPFDPTVQSPAFWAPGTVEHWVEIIDRVVPLQPVPMIVVRSFYGQNADDIQKLRRGGWNLLCITPVHPGHLYDILVECTSLIVPE